MKAAMAPSALACCWRGEWGEQGEPMFNWSPVAYRFSPVMAGQLDVAEHAQSMILGGPLSHTLGMVHQFCQGLLLLLRHFLLPTNGMFLFPV